MSEFREVSPGLLARRPAQYVVTVLGRETLTTSQAFRSLREAVDHAMKFTSSDINPHQYEKVTITDRYGHKLVLDLDLWNLDVEPSIEVREP